MNRKPQGLSMLTVSKCIEGFLQYKMAEGLSARTVEHYQHILDKWVGYIGDIPTGKVTSKQLIDYMTYMREDYVPQRITGNNEEKLSSKSIRNIYVALCSFFHWVSVEFNVKNPMKAVPAPKFTSPAVEPFTRDEIEALLKACEFKSEAKTDRRRRFTMRRPTALRDKAIILTLLDTGLRANELCSLRVADLDAKTGKVTVRHGVSGGAKGGKARFVYLGKIARKAVWRYLADREDGNDLNAPLFTSKSDRSFNRDALRQLINDIGKKAGVNRTYPHRFRHSMAISFLRAGGNLLTLKELLGHNSLEMVQRYARIADIDVEQAHRQASPVDNWRL